MENLLGLVRVESECPSKKCVDSAQTLHGLQAAVTVVSLPSWQLASSRGVRVESAESVWSPRSPCGVRASPRRLARNMWGSVKTSLVTIALILPKRAIKCQKGHFGKNQVNCEQPFLLQCSQKCWPSLESELCFRCRRHLQVLKQPH